MKNFDSKITKLKEQIKELKEGCYFTGKNREIKRVRLKLGNAMKSKLYYERSL